MRAVRTDLHIHTCLSPCADLSMVPSMIVRKARKAGLDLIAVTDHNATDNVGAVREAGRRAGLEVLAGMELSTAEEVHLLGIFPDERSAAALQETVAATLPGTNDPRSFGEQLIVDADDRVTGIKEGLLIGSTGLSLERAVGRIRELGGIVIASHVDREAFGLIGQLGFIPADLEFDGLEVTGPAGNVISSEVPKVRFSDAHFPEDIGKRCTVFMMERPGFPGLREALGSGDAARIRTG